jgi:hypothetical protein
MTFGAGLQFKESLAARVGVHLNGALPEVWVESLAFGSPGACAYNAAGRVITHALPVHPDIVVLCLCCNDAIMLAGQPDTAEGIGRTWIDYEPMLRTTLRTFREVVAAAGARPVVVFHDKQCDFGGVSMTGILGRICEDLSLPFLEGPSALASYPHKDLIVSVADGHLNGLANDAIARLVAQFILGHQWAPASKGYADGNWIEAIESAAHARVARGMPPAAAFGEALSVLDAKWMHRRNTSRRQLEPRYSAARLRLLDARRTSVLPLVSEACGRHMRTEHPLSSLTWPESLANEAMAVSFALEHIAVCGDGDGMLAHLGHLDGPERTTRPDPQASREQWQRVKATAEQLREALDEATACVERQAHRSPDLEYLVFWSSRVAQWCYTLERCAERYIDLLARIPAHRLDAVAGLIAYSDFRVRNIEKIVTRLRPAADRIVSAHRSAALLAEAGPLTLELVVSGAPGPGIWSVNVGLESHVPAFTERHVGCFNIIRDGEPHAYQLDIPLMVAGDIHLYVAGAGVSSPESGFKVYAASRLVWQSANVEPIPLPPVKVEAVQADTVALVSQSVHLLPVAR